MGAPAPLALPGRKPIGPETVNVFATGWQRVGEPTVNSTPHALAAALRARQDGDVFRVIGRVAGGVDLGRPGAWDGKASSVNGPIRDIAIFGGSPDARIVGGLALWGDARSTDGGVDELTLWNLELSNQAHQAAPLSSGIAHGGGTDAVVGMLRLYDCGFEAEAEAAWGGLGMNWNMRCGPISLDVRGCRFHAAREHKGYVDSVNGSGLHLLSIVEGCEDMAPSGRTSWQIVDRQLPNCPPSAGGLVFSGNTMKADGRLNDGGYVLTIAGFLGHIWIESNTIIGAGPTGGIVFWQPPDSKVTEHGFANGAATLVANDVDCVESDRHCCALTSVGLTRIRDFGHRGQRAAFSINDPFGGPRPCGPIACWVTTPGAASKYAGWDCPQKVVVGKQASTWMPALVLTDAQIDDLVTVLYQ